MAKVHRPKTRNVPRVVPSDLLPEEIRGFRVDLARTLKAAMPSFKDYVIHGKGRDTWNMTRLKAFQIVLSRVVPEVSENHHLHSVNDKRLHELSVEELHSIAASGIRKQRLEPTGWYEKPKVIDVETAAQTLAEPPPEERELTDEEAERILEEQELARDAEIRAELMADDQPTDTEKTDA